MNYKSIFVSDVHIGASGSKVKKLINFLKENTCENLFLLGDLIDGWELRRKWHWDSDCNLLIQKLLRLSRKGTKVIYIVGNHDEFMEHFIGHDIGDIHICMEYHYKNILLLHGHQFDGLLLQNAKWLQKIGSHGYNLLISFNIWLNRLLNWVGINNTYQLSKIVKAKVKSAVTYINNYETVVTDYARKHGFSTVMCGHIHQHCDKMINNIRYMNTGDFVENCTAIVEHYDGRLEILEIK